MLVITQFYSITPEKLTPPGAAEDAYYRKARTNFKIFVLLSAAFAAHVLVILALLALFLT